MCSHYFGETGNLSLFMFVLTEQHVPFSVVFNYDPGWCCDEGGRVLHEQLLVDYLLTGTGSLLNAHLLSETTAWLALLQSSWILISSDSGFQVIRRGYLSSDYFLSFRCLQVTDSTLLNYIELITLIGGFGCWLFRGIWNIWWGIQLSLRLYF